MPINLMILVFGFDYIEKSNPKFSTSLPVPEDFNNFGECFKQKGSLTQYTPQQVQYPRSLLRQACLTAPSRQACPHASGRRAQYPKSILRQAQYPKSLLRQAQYPTSEIRHPYFDKLSIRNPKSQIRHPHFDKLSIRNPKSDIPNSKCPNSVTSTFIPNTPFLTEQLRFPQCSKKRRRTRCPDWPSPTMVICSECFSL